MMGRPLKSKKDRLPIMNAEYAKIVELTKRDKSIKSNTKKKLLRAYGLLYVFGARVSEITNMSIDDIQSIYSKKEFLLLETKSNKVQKLFIHEKGIDILKQLDYSDCKTNLFYKNNSQESMSVTGFTKLINRYLNKYLNVLYTSHSFRAGFITRVIEKTGDIKTAQKLARHTDISMTLRYQNVSDKRIDDVLGQIF